jgi:hypothetical protein
VMFPPSVAVHDTAKSKSLKERKIGPAICDEV